MFLVSRMTVRPSQSYKFSKERRTILPAHEPHAQVVENQQGRILSVQGRKARTCSGESLLGGEGRGEDGRLI